MSVQPLVFEGPDPERLLLEALGVHGTDVRITEPTAVRRGGVFGFFQRLHYRIEVLPSPRELSEARRDGPCVPAVHDGSSSLRDALRPHASASAREAAANSAPTPRAGAPATAHALDALVEATEDRLEVSADPPVNFDALLERVAGSLGDDPAVVAASLAPLDTLPVAPTNALEPPGAAPLPSPRATPVVPRDSAATLTGRLTLAGVPRPLAADLARRASCLAEAAALFPTARPLPRTPGSLVAVVGPPTDARAAAAGLAEELGAPSDAVPEVLWRRRRAAQAGHLVAHSAREVADLHPGWRRGRVGVVAVGLSTPRADELAWCRTVLDALEPSFTLVLADAGAKPEDVAQRCAALGGADGLVLERLDETLTPATALSAGPPVARLAGRQASAALWADTLAAALERRGTRG